MNYKGRAMHEEDRVKGNLGGAGGGVGMRVNGFMLFDSTSPGHASSALMLLFFIC